MSNQLSEVRSSIFTLTFNQIGLILRHLGGELRKIATAAKTLTEWGLPELDPQALQKKEYMITLPEDLTDDDQLAQEEAKKKGIRRALVLYIN